MNKKQILDKLLSKLWHDYKGRVSYANQYANLVEEKGGSVINDHIAFRSFKDDIPNQQSGIEPFVQIFQAFDYKIKAEYEFETKKLHAIHLEHEDDTLPKIFISELLVDQFPEEFTQIITRNIASCNCKINDDIKHLLQNLNVEDLDSNKSEQLIAQLVSFFTRPWSPPQRADIYEANRFSQYAAWVLLHGNSVNHFTANINFQNVKEWPDIDSTLISLKNYGIPLKTAIEGEKGSILRQSATEAVIEDCAAHDAEGNLITVPWSYAYYEFAERGFVNDENSEPTLFQGFLGEQATNLFDMTDAKK
ncbi:MAG: DUF1338 domain-containing protein [Rickettsiales bacterium]|jgi:hypothetical protein|nr:DUF1338 domain-containing protein [Rickettsiales bacterium]